MVDDTPIAKAYINFTMDVMEDTPLFNPPAQYIKWRNELYTEIQKLERSLIAKDKEINLISENLSLALNNSVAQGKLIGTLLIKLQRADDLIGTLMQDLHDLEDD